MDTFYINGKFVHENEAVISVNDMSVLRGYGVFDFLRTYNRRPFYLTDHIKRLECSARLIDIPMPKSNPEIFDITMETLARNDHVDSNIRLVVTGGISPDSITPSGKPTLMVMVTELRKCPVEWYQDGVAIITTHDERYLPGSKSTNYIPAILAMSRARQQNAIESIYIDRYGRLLEGTTSNFFAFIGDTLVTPGISILPGITRQVVLMLTKDRFNIEVRDVFRNEVRLMEEVFITASNKEIVPIVRMDDQIFGDGTPGRRTKEIMQMFAEFTRKYGQNGEQNAKFADICH